MVTETDEYQAVERHYSNIALFLGDKDLRCRATRKLTPPVTASGKDMIEHWACPRQFNWKWQYLIRFLAPLVLILDALIDVFYPVVVASGGDGLLAV